MRRDDGRLFPIGITDKRTNHVIDLQRYTKPLAAYDKFMDSYGFLVATMQGWQLDLPFLAKDDLLLLTEFFLHKSSFSLYTEDGIKIHETEEEKAKRSPWPDAYEVPVLILGEAALRYQDSLPHFAPVTRLSLLTETNEISTLIHKNLSYLKHLPHYTRLQDVGFQEEVCLANKPFIRDIDKPISVK